MRRVPVKVVESVKWAVIVGVSDSVDVGREVVSEARHLDHYHRKNML